MIFSSIGSLLQSGLDYLIIITLLYTFICLRVNAVSVSYFFNINIDCFKHNNDSNTSQWSLINSQSLHVINNLQLWGRSHLSYPARHVTCDTCLLQISIRQQGSCLWRRWSEQTVARASAASRLDEFTHLKTVHAKLLQSGESVCDFRCSLPGRKDIQSASSSLCRVSKAAWQLSLTSGLPFSLRLGWKIDKTKVKSGWTGKMFDGFTEIYTRTGQ